MTPFKIRVPATSANLGPGFDALGLAFSLWLTVEAEPAEAFSIHATGRNSDLVGLLQGNLMLDTYRALAPAGPPLALAVTNEIPLGMGCGSSAAALVTGVLLANHFGELGWTGEQILAEACRREGHPDNVAACWFGGMTASSMQDGNVTAATLGADLGWRLVLAIPGTSLATEKARGLLPDFYSRPDVVHNIQATALLVSAFALDQPSLLLPGSRDLMHQPYRESACPLLPSLAGLAGREGICSVTLSGAGPSVLLILDRSADAEAVQALVRETGGDLLSETILATIAGGAVYN